MKLSIIVPVYNAAQYLRRFLKCFEGLQDAELILVDDRSTDGSASMLDEMAKERSSTAKAMKGAGDGHWKVRVLHLEKNVGVSKARQAGLEMAVGEYVIFADPDDLIDAGMYEGLISVAEDSGADLVFEDFFENDVRRSQKFDGDAEELICAILGGRIHGATWNKLIRRTFIVKSGARFCDERLGLCEDVDFLCQLLVKDPQIRYVDASHYHYVNVASSATHKLNEQSFQDLERVAARLTKILVTEKTATSLLMWRKGNRLACFLQKMISDEFFYGFAGDLRDLNGLSTNLVLKVLFWLGARGGRKWLLKFL